MRNLSLSMRVLVLAVLLPTAAAVCVVALVATGALHPKIVQMVAAGWAILVVAVLAAAISALGPKYRPTPLLTPLFAGIFAALLATTAIYAVRAHVMAKRTVVAAVKTEPARPAPAIAKPSIPPALAAVPQEPARQPSMATTMAPSFDTGFEPLPAEDRVPVQADVQPPPADAADRAAMGGPLVDVANAVVPPARAAEKPAAGAGPKPPVAVARIPVPATAPDTTVKANTDASVNLTARFDPSGPIEPAAAGPPIPLDAVDAAPAHRAAIPPLPRIRPCGGAGPACP